MLHDIDFYSLRSGGLHPHFTTCAEFNLTQKTDLLLDLGIPSLRDFHYHQLGGFKAKHPNMSVAQLYDLILPREHLGLKVDFNGTLWQVHMDQINMPPEKVKTTFMDHMYGLLVGRR